MKVHLEAEAEEYVTKHLPALKTLAMELEARGASADDIGEILKAIRDVEAAEESPDELRSRIRRIFLDELTRYSQEISEYL